MLVLESDPPDMARKKKSEIRRPRQPWFLKEWRIHRHLSQEELASRVRMTQGMISQLELLKVDYTASHLPDLAKALQCTVRDLLFRPPEAPESLDNLADGLPEPSRRQLTEIAKTFRSEH